MANLYRVVMAAAVIVTGTLPAATSYAQASKQEAQRQAYQYAMTCFVANTYAANNRKKVGDTAKAAVYLANAKRSFDGAVSMGRAMGLSNQTVNGDLDDASARELGRFMSDQQAFLQTASNCKALGLM